MFLAHGHRSIYTHTHSLCKLLVMMLKQSEGYCAHFHGVWTWLLFLQQHTSDQPQLGERKCWKQFLLDVIHDRCWCKTITLAYNASSTHEISNLDRPSKSSYGKNNGRMPIVGLELLHQVCGLKSNGITLITKRKRWYYIVATIGIDWIYTSCGNSWLYSQNPHDRTHTA